MDLLRVGGHLVTCAVAAVLMSTVRLAPAQPSGEKKPAVESKPLSAEQLVVYSVVLKQYLSGDLGAMNLSMRTAPIETEGPFAGHDCSQGLAMEPVQPNVVHSFKTDDLARLGVSSIHLVDPNEQKKEVEKNDPGKAIRKGISVDDAVRNGFAHALFTLSEIWFDKDHEHAIVSYRFWCGSLCGNGGTEVLVRKGANWSVEKQCGGWVS